MLESGRAEARLDSRTTIPSIATPECGMVQKVVSDMPRLCHGLAV